MFCPKPPSSGGCLWFGHEIRGPSSSTIAMAVATEPIATTTTLPALIQAEELETAAYILCGFLGAGLVLRPLKCNEE